jgi:hypothetical protein
MTSWKSDSPQVPSSPCLLSPWKAMPMARRIWTAVRMPINSPANMHTGSLQAGLGTTYPKKLHVTSPRPSWTSTAIKQIATIGCAQCKDSGKPIFLMNAQWGLLLWPFLFETILDTLTP